jgi:hypothetical protein
MLYPLIGRRLHGWLDDLVALTYVAGMLLFGLTGLARVVVLAGAIVHFTLTRLTNYPQGTWKLIPFRTHAFIELAEGILVLAAAIFLLGDLALPARAFVALMGLSQFVAFAFSDYGAAPALA